MLKCEGFVLRSVCVSDSLDQSNGVTMYNCTVYLCAVSHFQLIRLW